MMSHSDGVFPRVGTQCFDPPRKGQGRKGLGRDKLQVRCNRTRGFKWAGIKSQSGLFTQIDMDWATFLAGWGLTE
jgi:hypothetical protein